MRIIAIISSLLPIVGLIAASGCASSGVTALATRPTGVLAGAPEGLTMDAGSVPRHVLTSDLDDTSFDHMRISPKQARPWLDWVLVDPPHSLEAKAAGLTVMLYTDPNRQAPGGIMWTHDESTFAHDCGGHRISVQGSNNDLMDVHSNHLWALWPASVIIMQGWGAVWDYIFEDSADEIQTQKLSAMPCNFDQNDWTARTNQMDGLLGLPIMYNGLGLIPPGWSTPGPSIGLNPTTKGGVSEDCYVGRTPTGYFYTPHWNATENTELQMQHAGKFFICEADSYAQAQSSVTARLFYYASFLMTYDRNTQLVHTHFATPSELHVMPEAQLVPENPVVPTPDKISALALAGGLYGREYRSCYFAGSLVGRCAVVVNPNKPRWSPAIAFPWSSRYRHTLVVSGSGIYDGGTARVDGPPPPSKVAGGTGVIAFP